MRTESSILTRVRMALARHNLRVHKRAGNYGAVYFVYEIGRDDSDPPDGSNRRMDLEGLLAYTEELDALPSYLEGVTAWPEQTAKTAAELNKYMNTLQRSGYNLRRCHSRAEYVVVGPDGRNKTPKMDLLKLREYMQRFGRE